MRKPLIAGNWKMNTSVVEGLRLAKDIIPLVENAEAEIVICPPFTHLASIKQAIVNTNIELGSQDMYWKTSGAFTGEISPTMLNSIGCKYIIIGHSERRQIFGETNENTNKKVHSAIENGLKPILAVGETLDEHEQEKTEAKIKAQIIDGLKNIDNIENIVFAYEPIWAIGTGKTATPEQANNVIRFIRAMIGSLYTPDLAKKIRILYGGSVNPENINSLMSEPEIDGALVGGASLKPKSFAGIVNFKQQ